MVELERVSIINDVQHNLHKTKLVRKRNKSGA